MLIEEYRPRLPLARMCSLLKLSRSAYYAWRSRASETEASSLEERLKAAIGRIVLALPGYGYRRVTRELARQGHPVNHKRVLRLMKGMNLVKKRRRRFVRTTDSNHALPLYRNLAKNFTPRGPNQLWVADITYIRLTREFVYLAAIIDVFSRRVVGWALRSALDAELALAALRMALATRRPEPGLIHHSDRGVQYAASDYVDLLKSCGIRVSMSAKGNPYENAFAESFIATLKREEVYLSEYETLAEARMSIGSFIEDVYNEKRLHSSLGYVSPVEFENMQTAVECGLN